MELRGNAVSRGIAVGEILRHIPFRPELAAEPLQPHEVEGALAAYDRAKDRAREELARDVCRCPTAREIRARLAAFAERTKS